MLAQSRRLYDSLHRTCLLLRTYSQHVGHTPRPSAQTNSPWRCPTSQALRANSSIAQDAADISAEISRGERLLAEWQASGAEALQKATETDIRNLLRAAIGLRRNRAPGITDELQQLVMKLYLSQKDLRHKQAFLRVVCQDFGVQEKAVEAAIEAYHVSREKPDYRHEAILRASEKLRQACQPQYSSLFVPISNQPGGIKFLADLRSDVLKASRQSSSGDSPQFRALSEAIKSSLTEWFSIGLLSLRRISWNASSAALLEKVMQYEQVHPFSATQPWQDLKSRLSAQRRLFGFFHGSMPDEPLVLLHTALMPSISSTMGDILDVSGSQCEPSHARTAVFYSISSTQSGLTGIDLGNFLIKQVAHTLLRDFPSLKELATLSPLPGFAKWLLVALQQRFSGQVIASQLSLSEQESDALEAIWTEASDGDSTRKDSTLQAVHTMLMTHISAPSSQDDSFWESLLTKQAARYLLVEKRRGFALDPVANFHLRNGAEVWRINWKAYQNPDSFGIMVNYRYDLDSITSNNQSYLHAGAIAASPQVRQML